MGKRDKRSEMARLNVMVRDLDRMQQFLLPKGAPGQAEELKGMDEFQRLKHQLNSLLHQLTKDIKELNEMRKKTTERDARTIGLQNQNSRKLGEAKKMLEDLNAVYDRAAKKKKMAPEVANNRRRMLELFTKELGKLEQLNSRLGPQRATETQKTTDRILKRAQERAARRAQRRERDRAAGKGGRAGSRGGAGAGAGDEKSDEPSIEPISEQQQAFMDEVAQNDKVIDSLLDDIGHGLKELKVLAEDIGTSLDVQNDMLHDVEEKMDGTITEFKLTNKKLNHLIEMSGGATQWCPILITFCILIAVVGYVYSMLTN
eukprot:TRINITY_DN65753_c4_g1_i1.p1 TRINITY_DN65753_c4_g1~~TRINITY_DN65753_c4_g1_i1.p1  ORF type:complete len:324 (-),score=201.33 TRINITY_DN65753_c4_g1_i1:475-1422(-)